MRGWPTWILVLATGCIDVRPFVCDDDVQCLSPRGQCVAGNCVLDDAACPSGRYSEYADPEVAGQCYEPEPPASTGGEPPAASTSAGSGSDSGEASSAEVGSTDTGQPVPVELCNGIDDDGNGLVDEWSPQNVECEICPEGAGCQTCHLFPDDPDDPTRVYFMCLSGGYSKMVSFCGAIGAPPVSIHDNDENSYLAIKTTEFAQYGKAYIGARDFGEPGRPDWRWIDGSEFEFQRLGDALDMHGENDVCVMLTTSASWIATHPNSPQPFFCEAPLP